MLATCYNYYKTKYSQLRLNAKSTKNLSIHSLSLSFPFDSFLITFSCKSLTIQTNIIKLFYILLCYFLRKIPPQSLSLEIVQPKVAVIRRSDDQSEEKSQNSSEYQDSSTNLPDYSDRPELISKISEFISPLCDTLIVNTLRRLEYGNNSSLPFFVSFLVSQHSLCLRCTDGSFFYLEHSKETKEDQLFELQPTSTILLNTLNTTDTRAEENHTNNKKTWISYTFHSLLVDLLPNADIVHNQIERIYSHSHPSPHYNNNSIDDNNSSFNSFKFPLEVNLSVEQSELGIGIEHKDNLLNINTIETINNNNQMFSDKENNPFFSSYVLLSMDKIESHVSGKLIMNDVDQLTFDNIINYLINTETNNNTNARYIIDSVSLTTHQISLQMAEFKDKSNGNMNMNNNNNNSLIFSNDKEDTSNTDDDDDNNNNQSSLFNSKKKRRKEKIDNSNYNNYLSYSSSLLINSVDIHYLRIKETALPVTESVTISATTDNSNNLVINNNTIIEDDNAESINESKSVSLEIHINKLIFIPNSSHPPYLISNTNKTINNININNTMNTNSHLLYYLPVSVPTVQNNTLSDISIHSSFNNNINNIFYNDTLNNIYNND